MLRNMKLSNRFFALLGLAAAFAGCRPEEADHDLPKIKVDGPALTFDAETKLASCALDQQLVNIPLTVTANRDWVAEITWDEEEVPWIAVTPDHGEASSQPQQVTLTVLNNAGYNRNKRVKFSINYDYKSIDITQLGERGEEIIGTLDNPLTVAGAVKYVKNLGADVQSSSGVYVKGKISRIDDNSNFASSGTYGNATFYISDDGGTSSEQFYCYRVLYLGNKKWTSKDPDIKVGDDVIIYGYVVNYKGNTPETVQGTAFIYEHNGVNRGTDEGGGGEEGTPAGTGTVDDPYNVAAARAAVKDLTWTANDNYEKTGTVYVKGKISRIADNGTFGQSGTYGNASFYINDDGADGAELYAYRILYLGNKKYTEGTDIKVGDEVVICGELMNYRGNTPETVSNSAYLYSLNGEGGGGGTPSGGEAKGTGTLADPYNPLGAAKAVKDLSWTSNTEYEKTGDVYVKGKISRIADKGTFTEGGTYGNASFYISEDGTQQDEFYCFRILYLNNEKYTGGTDIKVGDEVIVCGKLMNYRGNTPETVSGEAYLYSLNGKTDGGGGTPDAGGSGTLEDPYTPEGAAAAVANLTWTSNTDYQKTEKVYVKGKISRIANNGTYTASGTYGNASYWISADGTENGEFQIYRSLYFNGEKYTEGTDIQVGDEVIVYGALMNYKGNTPETVANENWLYSLNGKTDGGGSTPPVGGSGTLEDPYTPEGAAAAVANLTWTSNTDYQKTEKVYVKGKISRIANNGTYAASGTYGNASYWISADGTENGEFQIYRSLYFNGEKYTEGTDIQVGDEVIVYGALMNYKGTTPETVASENWLYSLNGKTDGGGSTPVGGDGSVDNPYSVPEAINAVKDLTWTSNTDYQKTEKVYVKGKISRIANNGTYTASGTYGNASYWISADGTENDEFQIYRSLYFNGEKYTEGTDIKVGDEVIVYGALMNYKGTTPETVANENWLYSLNGKTDGGGSTPAGGDGTVNNPYSVPEAINAVKDLTWTSNTDYQKTEKVYLKGKISRIANNGTYTASGTYGNASYWISADGTENDEFQIYRSLYFNGEKYTEGTDIKVGDEVVVYGALMNYKGNTPETVANENWLYSLNGKTDGGSGGGGGDTPSGASVSFSTNSTAQTWTAVSDGTYGGGYGTTTQGLKVAYYKHTSSSNPVAPYEAHIRVYKNSALSISSTEGKKIKKIVLGCAPDAGTSSYCFDMTGLEGGANATADKAALTVTWNGSASKVVLHANNGQVRVEKLTVEFE
jgi:hypothetical protein